MQNITLRVISGPDRGHVFHELDTPITLGREDGNDVRLNDERISRYHAKIQEDDGRLVLTDLDSTNGTRVNGHPCNLTILRFGNTISIGRTVLIVGSKEQVADWYSSDPSNPDDLSDEEIDQQSTGLANDISPKLSSREISLPRRLSAVQSAELRELLDHLHEGLRAALVDAKSDEQNDDIVQIEQRAWQRLLMTQSELSELIRNIENPNEDEISDKL